MSYFGKVDMGLTVECEVIVRYVNIIDVRKKKLSKVSENV